MGVREMMGREGPIADSDVDGEEGEEGEEGGARCASDVLARTAKVCG